MMSVLFILMSKISSNIWFQVNNKQIILTENIENIVLCLLIVLPYDKKSMVDIEFEVHHKRNEFESQQVEIRFFFLVSLINIMPPSHCQILG